MVFQDPRVARQSGPPDRRLHDRGAPHQRQRPQANRRDPRRRPSRRGRCRRPAPPTPPTPPRVVRWSAPAGDDRCRTAHRTAPAARRRADHGARRHHPGRGDGDPRRAAARPRHGDAVHHPRPRPRRCGVRPHRRDVRRARSSSSARRRCCTKTRSIRTRPGSLPPARESTPPQDGWRRSPAARCRHSRHRSGARSATGACMPSRHVMSPGRRSTSSTAD